MCILDLSKTLIYDFHYNTIKKKYGENSKLLFTDTDSLCYEIETEDIYKDMSDNKEKFDFSNFSESSEFYNDSNKKVIGKFKDECGGKSITEFVGLRSKMYSFTSDDNSEVKTAKGINKNTIRKQIRHKDYIDTIFESKQMSHKMNTIRSVKHQIGSFKMEKISLSCFDDKRYILENGINSYAYGHYKI